MISAVTQYGLERFKDAEGFERPSESAYVCAYAGVAPVSKTLTVPRENVGKVLEYLMDLRLVTHVQMHIRHFKLLKTIKVGDMTGELWEDRIVTYVRSNGAWDLIESNNVEHDMPGPSFEERVEALAAKEQQRLERERDHKLTPLDGLQRLDDLPGSEDTDS